MIRIFICLLIGSLAFVLFYLFASNIDIKHNLLVHMLFWLVVAPIFISIGMLSIARLIELLQGNIDPKIHYDQPFDEWSN